MILSDFVLLDANSGADSNPWYMPPEATQITIQVTGAQDSLWIMGLVDEMDSDYVNLATINLTDFSVSSEITQDGIYAIGVSGIKSIIAEYGGQEGEVKVYGVCEG